MADQKATVTLKDGTKIEVTDLAELSKYSDRQDLDSISFFNPDEAADAGVADAGVADAGVETIATVEQPKADPVVPKPQPVGDHATAITATIGAAAGAISSAGMPALTNLAKSFIKGKFKLKLKGNNSGGDSKPEEEKEEPTDCKTHQIKAGAKFASISARLSALESRSSGESGLFNADGNPLEDLEERIEKLEKLLKTKKGKRK